VIEPATSAEATALFYLPRAYKRVTMQFDRWFAHGMAQVLPTAADEKETERLARIFAAAGIEVQPEPTSLRLAPEATEEAELLLAENGLNKRNFLVIHLGAGWPGRCWPLERFAELARRAHDEFGLIPVGLAGPGEEQIADAYLSQVQDLGGIVFLKPKLPTIFAIIGRASAFAGNDSAFMHAAAAQGVPTLGVFGPTELARFYPTGKHVATASLHLACSPCVQSYCTDQRCIKELDVDRVWTVFRELVQS
jgi:ADP-heptose:LPS heptosyltransferase